MKEFLKLVNGENSVYREYGNNINTIFITRRETAQNICDYVVFEDYQEFLEYYDNCENKHFHEIIPGGKPQRIRFDLDIKVTDINLQTTGYVNAMMKTIVNVIITKFNNIYELQQGYSICEDDVVITNSHKLPEKYSYHIIVKSFFLPNSYNVSQFAKECIAELPIEYHQYIDNVYKHNQSFRILNSTKFGESRPKRLTLRFENIPVEDTFIGYTDGIIVSSMWDEPEQHSKYHITDELSQQILTKFASYTEGFRVRKVGDGFIEFDRTHPSYCLLCSEVHHKDNTLMFIINDHGCFYYCRHKKQSMQLGESNAVEHVNETGELERAMQIPEEKIRHKTEIEQYNLEDNSITICPDQTYYLRAPMGMGKTKALADYIANTYPDHRVIFLTFRRTFSASLLKRFPGFISYMQIKEPIIGNEYHKLIIQVESLHRLYIPGRTNNLLVLDESESIIEQFSSGNFYNFSESIAAFKFLVKHSQQVVCMDANLATRTIESIEAFNRKGTKRFNNYIIQLNKNDQYHITRDKQLFLTKLCNTLANRRCVLATNSIKDAEKIYQVLNTRYPDKKIKLYTSKTADTEKSRHLSDVNQYWTMYDCIIYTPTISAGISFEIKDHFDCVFGLFNNKSCGVETARQMLYRVRDVKDREYNICISSTTGNLPTDINTINAFLENRKTLLYSTLNTSTLTFEYNQHGLPEFNKADPYYVMFVQNMIIRHKSMNNYYSRFVQQIKHTGAQIGEMTGDKNAAISAEFRSAEVECEDYYTNIANAEDITLEEYLTLSRQETLDDEEHYMREKYHIRKTYNWFDKPVTTQFIKKYSDRKVIKQYKNLNRIATDGIDNIQKADQEHMEKRIIAEDPNIALCTHKYTYLHHIFAKQLLHILGFPSMQHDKTLTIDEIHNNIRKETTNIMQHINMIRILFNIEKHISNEPTEFYKIIRKILRDMYGTRLKRNGERIYIELSADFTYNSDNPMKPRINI